MWIETARKARRLIMRRGARALRLLGLALLALFAPRRALAAEVYECSTRTAQGKSWGGEETEQQAKDNAHQVVRGLAGKQCSEHNWTSGIKFEQYSDVCQRTEHGWYFCTSTIQFTCSQWLSDASYENATRCRTGGDRAESESRGHACFSSRQALDESIRKCADENAAAARRAEETRKAEEEQKRRLEAEERKKKEEQKRLDAEAKKREEQRRKDEEEKRKAEEQKREDSDDGAGVVVGSPSPGGGSSGSGGPAADGPPDEDATGGGSTGSSGGGGRATRSGGGSSSDSDSTDSDSSDEEGSEGEGGGDGEGTYEGPVDSAPPAVISGSATQPDIAGNYAREVQAQQAGAEAMAAAASSSGSSNVAIAGLALIPIGFGGLCAVGVFGCEKDIQFAMQTMFISFGQLAAVIAVFGLGPEGAAFRSGMSGDEILFGQSFFPLSVNTGVGLESLGAPAIRGGARLGLLVESSVRLGPARLLIANIPIMSYRPVDETETSMGSLVSIGGAIQPFGTGLVSPYWGVQLMQGDVSQRPSLDNSTRWFVGNQATFNFWGTSNKDFAPFIDTRLIYAHEYQGGDLGASVSLGFAFNYYVDLGGE